MLGDGGLKNATQTHTIGSMQIQTQEQRFGASVEKRAETLFFFPVIRFFFGAEAQHLRQTKSCGSGYLSLRLGGNCLQNNLVCLRMKIHRSFFMITIVQEKWTIILSRRQLAQSRMKSSRAA